MSSNSFLSSLKLIIFDSDGIVLNSNHIKINCFCDIADKFLGIDSKNLVLDYILKNKHATRVEIINYIVSMNNEITHKNKSNIFNILMKNFIGCAFNKLKSCEYSPALKAMKSLTNQIPWAVVTAGDEAETKKIYSSKQIDHLFEAGIYGSPLNKYQIMDRLNCKFGPYKSGTVLFIGDSYTDFELSSYYNGLFVGIDQWSVCEKLKLFESRYYGYFSSLEEMSSKLFS